MTRIDVDWGHVAQWLTLLGAVAIHMFWKIKRDNKIENDVLSMKESCVDFKEHIAKSSIRITEADVKYSALEERVKHTEQIRRSNDKFVTLGQWKEKNNDHQKDLADIIKVYEDHTKRIYDRLNGMDRRREVACTDRDDKFERIQKDLHNGIAQTALLTGSVDGLQKNVDTIMHFILDQKMEGEK